MIVVGGEVQSLGSRYSAKIGDRSCLQCAAASSSLISDHWANHWAESILALAMTFIVAYRLVESGRRFRVDDYDSKLHLSLMEPPFCAACRFTAGESLMLCWRGLVECRMYVSDFFLL